MVRASPRKAWAPVSAFLVVEVTNSEFEAWKRSMVRRDKDDPEVERRGKDTANRVLGMAKAALNRAFRDEDNHIPSDSAWRRVVAFKDVARARGPSRRRAVASAHQRG